jgi:hypothetical protein
MKTSRKLRKLRTAQHEDQPTELEKQEAEMKRREAETDAETPPETPNPMGDRPINTEAGS